MDESPRQLISEARVPVRAAPGQPARHDYEYRRCGVCNVFLAAEPLAGKRMVTVNERRTKKDWAHFLEEIAARYESALKITLVMDNLNTHTPVPFTRKHVIRSKLPEMSHAPSKLSPTPV